MEVVVEDGEFTGEDVDEDVEDAMLFFLLRFFG